MIKKFKLFEEREGFDDIDYPFYDYDDDDDYYGRPYYSKSESDDDEYSEEEYDENDDMETLCHLLRQMFNNSGIEEVSIEYDDLNISMSIQFRQKESLSYLVKCFGVVKKIKKDILAQYEDTFEIWETKGKEPSNVITFDFVYDDGSTKSSSKDEDDYPW